MHRKLAGKCFFHSLTENGRYGELSVRVVESNDLTGCIFPVFAKHLLNNREVEIFQLPISIHSVMRLHLNNDDLPRSEVYGQPVYLAIPPLV